MLRLPMLTVAFLSVVGGLFDAPPFEEGHALALSNDVYFQGRDVYLGGNILNPGSKAEGLMMNSRMIQAAIDDYGNYSDKMRYPDGPWSAQRNLNEFMNQLPLYSSYGLNMVTVGMQGGHPRFNCSDSDGAGKRNFSMFTADGTLRSDAKSRLQELIAAASDADIIVSVQFFYQNQDNKLSGNAAVLKATQQATQFLRDLPQGNILIEVANEVSLKNYKHSALQPNGIPDRIDQIHGIWPGALVAVSMSGAATPGSAIMNRVDWVSFHGNSQTVSGMVSKINNYKQYGIPIAVTEDYWDKGAPLQAAVDAGAGWGFYEQGCEFAGSYTGAARYRDGFQSPPINWRISNPTKQAFFDKVRALTRSN